MQGSWWSRCRRADGNSHRDMSDEDITMAFSQKVHKKKKGESDNDADNNDKLMSYADAAVALQLSLCYIKQ